MKDRFDGRYIRDADAMHYIMPFLYPDRCDNQALFSFKIDLTALNEYLKKKSESDLSTDTTCFSASSVQR